MITGPQRNLAIVIGAVLGLIYSVHVCPEFGCRRAARFIPWCAVSAEQIREIGSGIGAYEGRHGARPARLAELVEAGMIGRRDLHDEQRRKIAEGPQPDVLYFPAVRKDDPDDLVLLCTLLLHDRDDRYQAVLNDGTYVAMTPRDLVVTLNRTYEYIGRKLPQTRPGTRTASE